MRKIIFAAARGKTNEVLWSKMKIINPTLFSAESRENENVFAFLQWLNFIASGSECHCFWHNNLFSPETKQLICVFATSMMTRDGLFGIFRDDFSLLCNLSGCEILMTLRRIPKMIERRLKSGVYKFNFIISKSIYVDANLPISLSVDKVYLQKPKSTPFNPCSKIMSVWLRSIDKLMDNCWCWNFNNVLIALSKTFHERWLYDSHSYWGYSFRIFTFLGTSQLTMMMTIKILPFLFYCSPIVQWKKAF